MRRALIFILFAGILAPIQGNAQTNNDARVRELMQALHLNALPKESGYLGIIGQSTQTVEVDGRPLAVQSQVYYMLTRDRPVNYLHWLAPDDTHILIEGGPPWTTSSFIPTAARK